MSYWQAKTVLVTGASAGLGLALSRHLLRQGARIVAVARGADRLQAAFSEERSSENVLLCPADVRSDKDMSQAVRKSIDRYGALDAVICCAGKSHRGKVDQLDSSTALEFLDLNFLGAVRTVHAALPYLHESRGHIVLIGSLAAKTASPFMGAYPTSKFPLAAYAQQLRLELGPRGVHTLLVCPGPIARPDAGERYRELAEGLPEAARRAGGGARLRGIDPARLADRILRATARRRPELVIPAKARALFVLQQLSPRLGDWLVRKMTG